MSVDSPAQIISVQGDLVGKTLASVLRSYLPELSWNQVRRMVESRRVQVGGEVCHDPARRVKEGEQVELLARSHAAPRHREPLTIRHLDHHLVVVEKPSGLSTVRHPVERDWPARRKALSPTLEDLVPPLIAQREGRKKKGPLPRLRIVQRLDKETSGLVVLARTVAAEVDLGRQFRAHTVVRRYLALVPGYLGKGTIRSMVVRDRGDGRRGSSRNPEIGKEAITHVEVAERLPEYTLLSCRLETGRTHQIRIHLAEQGHPICGEKVYNRSPNGTVAVDSSRAPRLALHAVELGFVHPVTRQELHWEMALPADLSGLLDRLR